MVLCHERLGQVSAREIVLRQRQPLQTGKLCHRDHRSHYEDGIDSGREWRRGYTTPEGARRMFLVCEHRLGKLEKASAAHQIQHFLQQDLTCMPGIESVP